MRYTQICRGFIFAFLLFSYVESARLFFNSFPSGQSHSFVHARVACECVRRGNNVTLVVSQHLLEGHPEHFECVLNTTQSGELYFYPILYDSFSDERMRALGDRLASMSGASSLGEIGRNTQVMVMEEWGHVIKWMLKEKPYDALIGDSPTLRIVMERLQVTDMDDNHDDDKVKKIQMESSMLRRWYGDKVPTLISLVCVGFLPPFFPYSGIRESLGVTPMMGLTTTINNVWHRVINVALYHVHTWYSVTKFYETYAPFFRDPMRMLKFSGNPFIFVTSWALESPRSLPPNVFLAGAVSPRPARPLPPYLSNWISQDNRPIVFISLGTTTNVIPQDRLLLRSLFSSFPNIRFIWRVRLDSSEPPAPDNVLVASSFVPQNDLLPHMHLFITHGGFNSVAESAYHACPMLVLARFGDQPENGATVERIGGGISLHLGSVTSDHLLTTFQHMLDHHAQYKYGIENVSRVMRHENGAKSASRIIQHLLNTGHQHLIPFYSTQSWLHREAVDATIIFILSIFTLLSIISYILLLTIKCCCRSPSNKIKQQ